MSASMTVWDDLVGQEPTIETLSRAVRDEPAMTHAWLFTGPPGSRPLDGGPRLRRRAAVPARAAAASAASAAPRSTAPTPTSRSSPPRACRSRSPRPARSCRRPRCAPRWVAGASSSSRTPTASPPTPTPRPTRCSRRSRSRRPRTVWMLCAPSLEDVIVTIRSRSRHVRLRTPPVEAVADLLQRRDGVDPAMALYAARAAQSHVGLARRLARDEQARIRRRDVVAMATKILGVGDAIGAAADLAQIADEESSASATERDAAERARLLETLGADPTARTQPPHIRSQVAALEREQKTRATRHGPRRRRPGPRRPHLGLPRRARAAPALRRRPRQPRRRRQGAGARRRLRPPSSCSARWTPSTRPATASTPTCRRCSRSRPWPCSCGCRATSACDAHGTRVSPRGPGMRRSGRSRGCARAAARQVDGLRFRA